MKKINIVIGVAGCEEHKWAICLTFEDGSMFFGAEEFESERGAKEAAVEFGRQLGQMQSIQ